MKFLISLSLLILSIPAYAESRKIDISLFCLKYVTGLETLHIPSDDASLPVLLSTANLTRPTQISLQGDRAVFHSSAVSDSEHAPAAAASVNVPKEITKALVVLIPNRPGSTEPYHALLVDHGDTFRLGSYRMINFSNHPIRGSIGPSFVQTGVGAIADLELQQEPGTIQALRFEFFENGRWKRLTESRCAVRKDRRWLLCIYQDPITQRMNMKSIPDRTLLLKPVREQIAKGEAPTTNLN